MPEGRSPRPCNPQLPAAGGNRPCRSRARYCSCCTEGRGCRRSDGRDRCRAAWRISTCRFCRRPAASPACARSLPSGGRRHSSAGSRGTAHISARGAPDPYCISAAPRVDFLAVPAAPGAIGCEHFLSKHRILGISLLSSLGGAGRHRSLLLICARWDRSAPRQACVGRRWRVRDEPHASGEGPYCRPVRERWVRGAARRSLVRRRQRVAPVPGRRKPRRHRRSTRSCREYQLIKDSCYKLNRHVACARQKFRQLPHFGRRLCNANHLRFRRYPKVRLDHLPCRSSAYVSPVRAQWGADYFGLRPIDFIHRQSGRR